MARVRLAIPALTLLLLAACSAPSPASTWQPARTPAHVYLVVFENRGRDTVLGSGDAPAFDALAARYATASDFHALARPSQPNYLALWSGSTQGVADNGNHDISAPTIASQLEDAGRDWMVYAENVPAGCFAGATSSGGPDGEGIYARKHEPAISFTAVSGDQGRCARIAPLSAFDPAAADLELIVPNLCHDMHDCPVAAGDAWLAGFLPRITGSDAWAAGGIAFITFDESETSNDDTRIPMIVMTTTPQGGLHSDVYHDHYGLLATIERLFGLPCLDQACHAEPMGELLPGS